MVETWLVGHFMEQGLGLSEEALELLREVPEDSLSPRDAWLRCLMATWCPDVEQDRQRAAAILKPHENDPQCAVLLGDVKQLTGDDSVIYWQRSAEAGCCEGVFRLGVAYWYGDHVAEDHTRGFKLLCKAAEMLHPGALSWFGDCYLRGEGVKQDVRAGLRYYAQAINLGNRDAIYSLARAYYSGWGVAQDLRRAASLSRQALLEGHPQAQNMLDLMRRDHPQDVIPYGEWRPDEFLHQFVPDEMHHQMRTVLLMHAQKGSLFSALPRDVVVHHICFWICTE